MNSIVKPRGQKPHIPTDVTRAEVRCFAICQWPEEKIANYLDICVETLKKHYTEELRKGAGKILYKACNVMEKWLDKDSLKAAMYVLSSKGGFVASKEKKEEDDKEKSTLVEDIQDLIKKHEREA